MSDDGLKKGNEQFPEPAHLDDQRARLRSGVICGLAWRCWGLCFSSA
jgi:hypothetical protein